MSDKCMDEINETIQNNQVVVYSKTYCPYCVMAKKALDDQDVKYKVIELDNRSDGNLIQDKLYELTKARTVPRVFINGKCIGGGSETSAAAKNGTLKKLLNS